MLRPLCRWFAWSLFALTTLDVPATALGQLTQDAMADDLRKQALTHLVAQQRQEVQTLQVKMDQARSQLLDTEKEIHNRSQRIVELETSLFEANLSPQSYSEVLAALQTMRVQLKVDLAGLRARQQMVRELVDQGHPQERIDEKKLVIAQSMLNLAMQRLGRSEELMKTGNIPTSEVAAAEIEMRQAELRVLESEAAIERHRSESVQTNRDIVLELTEKDSRLMEVETMLKSAVEARGKVREIKSFEQAIQRLEAEQRDVASMLANLRVELASAVSKLERLENELAKKQDK